MPVSVHNLLLLVTEAIIYFSVMVALLHFRRRLGLGVFLTALGVMHFLETYLAAVFYVELPFGTASPGSSVLFAGKLMLILMLYIREDAATVRQPIYGLFIGNLVMVAMAFILQYQVVAGVSSGAVPDAGFLKEMGWLMLWGTTLLYVDSLGIILLYERLGRRFPRSSVLRFVIAGAIMLTFDQVGFFSVLHVFLGVPVAVFWDGWAAKIFALILYSVLYAGDLYLRHAKPAFGTSRPLADIFGDLTFRERYENLLAKSGRDSLTGAFDRNRLEEDSPALINHCLHSGAPVSLVMLDVDHFKLVNDRFGHIEGDRVLRVMAEQLQAALRAEDSLYRFGGEEFVVVLPRVGHEEAMALAERLRQTVESRLSTPDGKAVTISCGVATGPADGQAFHDLMLRADERLYFAKGNGRNRVCGREMVP
ncbi:MAG: GGDEF domain-containing protein [Proteobacteria bacterium]|nr:GGDEF domain-containing protein [Pseudomonadota bacterium]